MDKLKNNIIFIPIITSIVSIILLISLNFSYNSIETENYSTFSSDLNDKNISEVDFNKNDILTVTLKNGIKYKTINPDSPTLKETLLSSDVKINNNSNNSFTENLLTSVIVISLFSLIFMFVNKGRLSTNSKTDLNLENFNDKENFSFTFKDVAGNEEAKESLNDIVDFLKTPEKYSKYGAKMPKGVILYGTPGTGKTLLAKAVAGEANVPFYALSGSDFVQVYVGVGASRIRNLFKKAKSHGKAVIFIDEIDAIGKTRAGGNSATGGGNDERDQTLNALLTEMSGFNEAEGIVVIAATNRLDTLDSALLRPGRFDRHVEVALPDVNAREKIINLYLNNKPHKHINTISIAKKTAYFSGAKLEALINEAAILAAKENSEYINQSHINNAYSTILAGNEKKDNSHLSDSDKLLTSYHEAGHALLSMIKVPQDLISKVTIIPTTKGAGGYTLTIPKDSNYHELNYIKNKIMVLLAGRASEELKFGADNVSTGAQGDISESTKLVLSMITEYGMGESIGLLKLSHLGNLSSSYGPKIIEECKSIIDSLYSETLDILKANFNVLDKLALELFEKETLEDNDLEEFISLF